jgi:tetratricopeptide (TPR) repeat protein
LLSWWNARLKEHPRISGSFLTLFTVITYWGALRNSFVMDDEPQILINPFVVNPHLWTKIFTGSVWSFNSVARNDNFYRPLQIFYYWIVYRAAGPNPGVYHLLQILIYAATAWLVYRLGCEIFKHECAALLGTVLWILHPVHVEPVAWISGMADVGCGFFYLLAFLLFVRAEKTESPGIRPHIAIALLYLPSLFFKEMALSFPLIIITYWLWLSPSSSKFDARFWAERMFRWIPYASAAATYIVIRVSVLGSFGSSRSLWKVSLKTLASSFALLGEHARLFVWPLGLNPFRTFNAESSLRSPWPLIALLVLVAVLYFRKRDPQLSFLMAWWPVTLLPCLDIRQLSFPQVADRFSYLPSVGLCLAISLAISLRLPEWALGERLLRVAAPALGAVMVFWASLTVLDIPMWRTKASLMESSMGLAPDSPDLHVVHGDLLCFREGDLDGAEREYRTALLLNKNATVRRSEVDYDCYIGLGTLAQRKGQFQQAIDNYQQATRVLPGSSPAYNYLGALFFPRGDYASATPYFVHAVAANPQDISAHIFLGNCWMKLGKFQAAENEFHLARTIDPTLKQAYLSEALALEALGDMDGAAKVRESYH